MSKRPTVGPALVGSILLLLGAACSSSSSPPPSGETLAVGTWGGQNAGVTVADSITHVHVGCTFGNIPGRVALRGDGRFTIAGSYVLRAYPVMVGPQLPAEYRGRVNGRTLTLEIAVNDTVARKMVSLGPVTVIHERPPELGPCPICTSTPAPSP